MGSYSSSSKTEIEPVIPIIVAFSTGLRDDDLKQTMSLEDYEKACAESPPDSRSGCNPGSAKPVLDDHKKPPPRPSRPEIML